MADGDQITAEEYASWVPAPEAIKRVSRAMDDWGIAADAILTRLDAGLLLAHIKTGTVEANGKTKKLKNFVAIPSRITKVWANANSASVWRFWTSGDAEITLQSPGDFGYPTDHVWRLFGIRFDPDGIAELAPSKATAPTAPIAPTAPAVIAHPPPSTPGKHAGGAPKKDFWDDLWAAISAQLYEGDLKPTKQADIEQAMLDWASLNGKDLSEPSARTRARKLWVLLKDKN